MPNAPIVRPATAGPTTRAALNIAELRATALPMSPRPTISTTKLWRTGMSIALAVPRQQRQDDDHPDLDDTGQREHGEDRGEHHHHGLHDEDRLALRQDVGEHAAEQAEDHHREELRGSDHAQPERVVGELEDEPGLGDLLHPRPDQRDELAAEEQLVVAVAEGAQPSDGVHGHRPRPVLVALGDRSMPARWSARWRRRASASSIISAMRTALSRSVSI